MAWLRLTPTSQYLPLQCPQFLPELRIFQLSLQPIPILLENLIAGSIFSNFVGVCKWGRLRRKSDPLHEDYAFTADVSVVGVLGPLFEGLVLGADVGNFNINNRHGLWTNYYR